MMQKNEKDLPIRIVKKKNHHKQHHGGSWKVAYADFVTAMLALFIVLWILNAGEDVKQAVAGYFQDPSGYLESYRSGSILDGGRGLSGTESPIDELLRRAQEQRLLRMGENILEELRRSPRGIMFLEQITFEIVDEGLRIELLETSESFFFDIGTAELQSDAIEVLRTIAKEIGELPNNVIIEGHTDSRQYSTIVGYTNFELSVDRANSARRVLATGGLRENQIVEVRGYADQKLRNKEDPYDASNRRISIIIKFDEPEYE